MLLQIEFVIDTYDKSPRIVSFIMLFICGLILMKMAGAHKASAHGINLHASRGKLSNTFKKITYGLGVSCIIMSFAVLFGFVTMPASHKDSIQDESDIIPYEEGYGEFPVIRIKRNCFERESHEYENYTLLAKSYDYEINAIRLVSTLDSYNIKNVKYYKRQCESIPMIRGDYFVFLGRRCNSLNSILQYEQKYETMFKGVDSMDLKIVKWEEGNSVSNLY